MILSKKNIAIVGGGASALSFACFIDTNKYNVTIYEKNNALGRKFLVAGNGGFNLTHSEAISDFCLRYTPSDFMRPFVEQFSNNDFRNWLQHIGIETYIGSSKRVFPKRGIKPIQVLQAIERQLQKKNVTINYNYTWLGFKNEHLHFIHKQIESLIKPDITVFALGGSSWKITGSNGEWFSYFSDRNIEIIPFQASNGAFGVNWEEQLLAQIEGKAIKNAVFSFGNKQHKGEAVITQFGIEGSGVYPLSALVRDQLQQSGEATLLIDFKPDVTLHEIEERITEHSTWSMKEVLEKKINLTTTHIALLKSNTNKEQYHSAEYISQLIKAYPLTITSLSPIDEAISTVGGISLNAVNKHLELKQLPQYYCIGEMLDWDAPTGGYLLQACFSMGYFLANTLNNKTE